MKKSIFELDKDDVAQYMADKGIKDCPLCGSENTLEPVYDDDLKLVYRTAEFRKYDTNKKDFVPFMDSCDVLICCTNCGQYQTIAHAPIAVHLDLSIEE